MRENKLLYKISSYFSLVTSLSLQSIKRLFFTYKIYLHYYFNLNIFESFFNIFLIDFFSKTTNCSIPMQINTNLYT